jgi:hypothetical protein
MTEIIVQGVCIKCGQACEVVVQNERAMSVCCGANALEDGGLFVIDAPPKERRRSEMSGTGASPLSNYRARRRWQINELLGDLTSLNLEPALKESLRQRLVLLLRDVEYSHSGDRLLASKIRDARVQLVALAKS